MQKIMTNLSASILQIKAACKSRYGTTPDGNIICDESSLTEVQCKTEIINKIEIDYNETLKTYHSYDIS